MTALPQTSIRVLRLRLKDKHAPFLRERAKEVNLVWNYTQDLALKVLQRENRFVSAFDVAKYTKGAGDEGLGLHSQTVQAVSEEYVLRRKQHKKAKLRWRVSSGPLRNLGWIPFKASAIRYRNGQLFFFGMKKPLGLWDSYGLSKYDNLGAGSISEDARGRWYINITVKVPKPVKSAGTAAIGIDLGLKDFFATSEPDVPPVEAPQFYRGFEEKLGEAQRKNKKARVKAIHAKIANKRKDFLHKLSTSLIQRYGAIFVGDVSASGLAKTRMAKSVLDASWSTFRTMLQYKSDDAGVWFDVVDEKYSSQTCSVCGCRSGPKGLLGLAVRNWKCIDCGAQHHRDVNSAQIIKTRGLARLSP